MADAKQEDHVRFCPFCGNVASLNEKALMYDCAACRRRFTVTYYRQRRKAPAGKKSGG